jgi:hypothetical protein
MDLPEQPHRCPKCNALVVDRRFPNCTTCRTPLPKEWIMTPEQIAKTKKLDHEIHDEHLDSMKTLDSIRSSTEGPRF